MASLGVGKGGGRGGGGQFSQGMEEGLIMEIEMYVSVFLF